MSRTADLRNWSLAFEGRDPARQGLRETLCTLGNGHFATRGAPTEVSADGVHYPGTYLAGGYNRVVSRIAGREIENEDLVNLPNWLPLTIAVDRGHWFRPDRVELLDCRQVLNLRDGLLVRETALPGRRRADHPLAGAAPGQHGASAIGPAFASR
ncbi:MAG: hypothetical protein U5K33_03305 [Halofilum sp. (in: g-proteobacteria)]|nr:hypothetical protein [Halofilum sp. (in: g-proteobacteria)]